MHSKQIPGFDGRYLIDKGGCMFTTINTRGNALPEPKKMTITVRRGIKTVQLRWNGKRLYRRVSALLDLTFKGIERTYKPGHPKVDIDSYYDVVDNGCWIWRGARDSSGYGAVRRNKKAHRIFYERAYGRIPNGMLVCHKCDTPPCVNPDHLFLGTTQDNNADKVNKGRHAYGERQHKSKLTDITVRKILESNEPCFVLAQKYGVTDTNISFIKLGKTWKHVPRPDGYSYTPYRAPGDHTKYGSMK